MPKFLPNSQLTHVQELVLAAFFDRERGFFLTGGAALAGFYIGHRRTDDLDLFTTDVDAFERGRFVVADVAQHLNAQVVTRQEAPGFRRMLLTMADGASLVIDLVRDAGVQTFPQKREFEQIIVDSIEEILVNKLTAIVGRAEERDLVDLYFLAASGLSIVRALPAAEAKDGGCTPANLAWLLSEVDIPDGITLPAQLSAATLRAFVADLIVTLRRLALPAR